MFEDRCRAMDPLGVGPPVAVLLGGNSEGDGQPGQHQAVCAGSGGGGGGGGHAQTRPILSAYLRVHLPITGRPCVCPAGAADPVDPAERDDNNDMDKENEGQNTDGMDAEEDELPFHLPNHTYSPPPSPTSSPAPAQPPAAGTA